MRIHHLNASYPRRLSFARGLFEVSIESQQSKRFLPEGKRRFSFLTAGRDASGTRILRAIAFFLRRFNLPIVGTRRIGGKNRACDHFFGVGLPRLQHGAGLVLGSALYVEATSLSTLSFWVPVVRAWRRVLSLSIHS